MSKVFGNCITIEWQGWQNSGVNTGCPGDQGPIPRSPVLERTVHG